MHLVRFESPSFLWCFPSFADVPVYNTSIPTPLCSFGAEDRLYVSCDSWDIMARQEKDNHGVNLRELSI